MDILLSLIDILVHLDRYIIGLVETYGVWIYLILFLVIFAETGLVVTPFLPGDSLLFVAGAVAALGGMDIVWLNVLLLIAAVLGNSVNFAIGRYLGPKVFHWENSRLFNRDALVKTHAFYEKHGGKTLVISRFLPIFRTFAPFVAGIGSMNPVRFTLFNVVGALAWIVSLTLAGYWFGNQPWIKQNLTLVILAIIGLSLLPVLVGVISARRGARAA